MIAGWCVCVLRWAGAALSPSRPSATRSRARDRLWCGAIWVFGRAEGGNFPAASKTVGEMVPKKEPLSATGIYLHSGCTVGIVAERHWWGPWNRRALGWPYAFLVTDGGWGRVDRCVVVMYRHPETPRVSSAELARHSKSDPRPGVNLSWGELFAVTADVGVTRASSVSPVGWF